MPTTIRKAGGVAKRNQLMPGAWLFLALFVTCCAGEPIKEPSPAVSSVTEKPYVRGLTADYLRTELHKRGLECREATKEQMRLIWQCALSAPDGVNYRVDFLGESPTRIEHVMATVSQTGAPREEPLIQFLGHVAASSYEGSEPAKAHQWTDQKVRDNDEVVIGGIKLRLAGPLTARSLMMFPVGSEWE